MTFHPPPGPIKDTNPRCLGKDSKGNKCNKLLAIFVTRPWQIQCRHCKTVNGEGRGYPDGTKGQPEPDSLSRRNGSTTSVPSVAPGSPSRGPRAQEDVRL